jgi:hypothetical protein
VQHIHIYVTRVPGALANGSPESEPGFTKTSLGERATYVETAGPGDFYRSTHPPRVTRRWLLRDPKLITQTCETVDAASAWYAQWIESNPRPDGNYHADEPQDARRARKVDFVSRQLAHGSDVVDGFYTAGGEYLSASLIPCPPRKVPAFLNPPCPLGRAG